jgi:outer membrane lipoprotein-sorting protein
MMKKYRIRMRLYLSIFIGLLFFGFGRAQNDVAAKEILDKVSSTMSAYDNLSMDFDYVLDNQAEDVQQEMSGDVVLEGDKYVVNLFGTQQIFDGSSTYTIIPENEEVNISGADIDEDNAFTPSKFYSFYKSGYTYTMDELKNINGKKIQFVKLTPIDSDSEISVILVGIDLKSNHIYQIIEIGANETRTILTASNIKTNQKIDKSLFIFDEKKYEELNYMINK